jgi:hypothetical protein
MKTKSTRMYPITIGTLAFAGLLVLAAPRVKAEDGKTNRSITTSRRVEVNTDADHEQHVVVKVTTDQDQDDDATPAKDRAWLGVAIQEAPEALAEQLELDPGVGLVVTHVSADSPAAQAGLKNNDVLVELAGQSLVLPAQLRKLVQARKPGDKVKLVFYRAGKKQTESATLEKAPDRYGLFDDGGKPGESWRALELDLRGLPDTDALHAQAKALNESLRHVPGAAKVEIQAEIKRGMEQARKAIEEAARELKHNKGSLQKESARLTDLLRSGINVDENATVVVRSTGKSSRSLVKTDDTGTIILIGPPHLHLTARDKAGKLLFDGEIGTAEQQAKVPRDLWERVEPLIDKEALEPTKPEKAESDSKP